MGAPKRSANRPDGIWKPASVPENTVFIRPSAAKPRPNSIWQSEFGLGFAALGLMKTVFSGTLAGFQIPSGLLAERFGAPIVLAFGTALAGLGYCLAGLSNGMTLLVAALFVGGLGASTQHPLASSLIAHAFAGKRSLKALGTYNFAGDIGKMTLPAAASLLFVVLPWREAVALLGGLGVLAGITIFVMMPRFREEPASAPADAEGAAPAPARSSAYGFPLLLSVGVIDSATRMAFLPFLPFVLPPKGPSLPTIGLALTLVFADARADEDAAQLAGRAAGEHKRERKADGRQAGAFGGEHERQE